jgi:hypothetical protein
MGRGDCNAVLRYCSQPASHPAKLLICISDVQCHCFRSAFNVDRACLKEISAVPCVLWQTTNLWAECQQFPLGLNIWNVVQVVGLNANANNNNNNNNNNTLLKRLVIKG